MRDSLLLSAEIYFKPSEDVWKVIMKVKKVAYKK
jgi:hypothetical protein